MHAQDSYNFETNFFIILSEATMFSGGALAFKLELFMVIEYTLLSFLFEHELPRSELARLSTSKRKQ